MNGFIALLDMIATLAKFIERNMEQRRESQEYEAERRARELINERRERLDEIKIQREHNRNVMEEQRIDREQIRLELERLKVLELKRKMGMTSEEFKPENYE